MNIKKFFNNLHITARINLYMAATLLVVIISMVGFYFYEIDVVIERSKEEIFNELDNLVLYTDLVEQQTGKGFNQEDQKLLKPVFNSKQYFETGFPYLVDKTGILLIHPQREGKKIIEDEVFKKQISLLESKGYFNYSYSLDNSNRKKWVFFEYYEPYNAYITISVFQDELLSQLFNLRNFAIAGLLLAIFVFFFGVYLIMKPIIAAINKIVFSIGEMAKGRFVKKIEKLYNDEIGKITDSMNVFIEGLTKTARFSNEIGKGNLKAEFTPLSEDDVLGNSLLEMRKSLIKAKHEEDERKIEVEKQNWATQGLAKFADILRLDNNNINKLTFNILSNLINYVDASQGAIFILNESNPKDVFYELTSAIAYDREKLMKKQVRIGEELVGRVAHEKLTIYLKEIPENYIKITSGMGTANPRTLLLVPLLLNDKVYGVIELASFNDLEKHQIEFIEKLGETIASTVSTVKINEQTAKLLEQSQQQSEELAAQEEEMRQNLEELMATQEESGRQQSEMNNLWEAINSNNLVMVLDLDEKITEVNSRFADVVKKGREKLVGSRCFDVVGALWKNFEEYKAFIKELKSGMSLTKTIDLQIDNNSITIAQTFTPILDKEGSPEKILYIGIVV